MTMTATPPADIARAWLLDNSHRRLRLTLDAPQGVIVWTGSVVALSDRGLSIYDPATRHTLSVRFGEIKALAHLVDEQYVDVDLGPDAPASSTT